MYYSLARSPLRLPGSADIVLYCFILFYRVLRFHGDVTCFIMWDIMVHRVIGRNMARIQRMFPAAYKFVPPTWVGLWDDSETSEIFGAFGAFGDRWADNKQLQSCRGHPRWFPWLGEEIWWQPGVKGQWPILFGTWNVEHWCALLVSAPSAPLVSALKNMQIS